MAHDVGDGPRGVEIPIRSGIPILSNQLRLGAGARRGHHKLRTGAGRQKNAGLALRWLSATARSNGVTIDRHHLHGLRRSVHDVLQIQDGVCSSVRYSPQFLLRWIGLDDCRCVARIGHGNIVDRKIPGRNVRVVGFRRRQQLVADDKGALGQPRQCGIDVLQTFDDQRSGCASLHLPFRKAVRVRMVPVESRGFVLRDLHVVIEALAGLNQRVDNLILSADGRHIGSMEVDIGRSR